jgi:sulfite exporter TauE/SafE
MDPLFFQFLTGVTLGLPTSLHCVAMCGGIMGALGLSAPASARGTTGAYALHAGAINMGRITTYALAGSLAGLGGLGAVSALEQSTGYFLLRVLAGMTLMFVGFSLLGIAGFSEGLNRIMAPMARPLNWIGSRLNRVNGLHGAVLKGAIWGLLPCGLVYSALVYAALSGGPYRGAAVMAGFGLATVPALIAAAFGVNFLTRVRERLWFSRLAGLIIIGFAVATYLGLDVQMGELVCKLPA